MGGANVATLLSNNAHAIPPTFNAVRTLIVNRHWSRVALKTNANAILPKLGVVETRIA
eukprot:CAMPEP_0113632284 /NCGR_PEP_ID=MMETSP0017_2-20120614/16777_1 /TAXON_ID=2856 /ORGANISM="Cylindrotheca closterium" /LENGTH=57 /DNA_ID=CAMNT_0000542827 /DNA_START=76 /DNA_END=245 /DNA_ORIENTATION=- /assembly_acc=CAM_ASM_000147